jgi:hypothetical protein
MLKILDEPFDVCTGAGKAAASIVLSKREATNSTRRAGGERRRSINPTVSDFKPIAEGQSAKVCIGQFGAYLLSASEQGRSRYLERLRGMSELLARCLHRDGK